MILVARRQSGARNDGTNAQQCGTYSPHTPPVSNTDNAQCSLLLPGSNSSNQLMLARSLTAVATAVSNIDQHCEPRPKQCVAPPPSTKETKHSDDQKRR
ncbi:MAG TPA: hypothetical protein VLI90_11085, partial [Tepidisphaeraceae bacterium]|nr:hypothetical protein [Tepidisphaeraceae bacterium]